MAKLVRRLALLAGAAEAARRYAQKNPDKAGKLVDQAAQFIDKQTKGKYHGQIDGVARQAKSAAGIPGGPGAADTRGAYGAAPAPYTPPQPPVVPPATPAPNGQSATAPLPPRYEPPRS